MSNDERTQSAGRKIAGLGTTMLIVANLFGVLLFGLVASAPRASAGLSAPQPTGDPTSGWIPDVAVASDPLQAERNPAIITAANGDLYMAYETGISGSRDIYFTTSSDGGNSWALPVAVAASGVNEVAPSIAQDPFSGRIFVAYAAGISGATPIHAAYSDDGITWTDRVVLPCGVLCVRPRIVSEYWNGTNNMVYVALSGQISANDWNMAVARSSDHGASWTWYESGLGPTDVRYQPDIAVQKGTDGVDRVFVFYRGGATFPGTTGYVEWSTTHGSSFAPRASWYSNVYTPPAVAAAHDGSSLLLAYSTNTPQVTWAQVPNPTDLTTFTGTWAFLPTAGVLPAVTVDGTGTVSTAIGGSYYLIAYDTGTGIFNVTAPVTLTSNADWSSPQTVSDTAAIPSSTAYDLTITAQLRTGTWYPAVAWTDARTGNDDVFYSTPGASTGLRVTIDSVPSGMRVTLDGTTRIAPATFWVSAGFHTVSVPSPQAGAPGYQHTFTDWSDGGALSHTIDVTADMSLTASFSTQVYLTLTSIRGGVSGAGWYDLGGTATITATSPQPGATGTQYAFTSWSGAITSTSLTTTVTMDAPKTATANWITQYLLTLNSVRGGVSGGGWYNAGDTATITATSPQAGTAGTQYKFGAWTGDIYSLSSAAFVTMNAPHTVTALWQTEYYLTTTSAHGNVTASAWFGAGDLVVIRIQATQVVEGGKTWDFAGWSGDASGTSQSVNVTMYGPLNVTATWREKPSDFLGGAGFAFLLAGLLGIVLAILLLLGLLMRKRRRPQAAYPPMPITPGNVPAMPPPPAPAAPPAPEPAPAQPPPEQPGTPPTGPSP